MLSKSDRQVNFPAGLNLLGLTSSLKTMSMGLHKLEKLPLVMLKSDFKDGKLSHSL